MASGGLVESKAFHPADRARYLLGVHVSRGPMVTTTRTNLGGGATPPFGHDLLSRTTDQPNGRGKPHAAGSRIWHVTPDWGGSGDPGLPDTGLDSARERKLDIAGRVTKIPK
jgi:hypothetical protein